MLISIIICTRNRAESLKGTLESALSIKTDNQNTIELIVVNNNSTDHTDKVILEYQKKFNGRLIGVSQKKRGLSNARNAGINQSKGDVLAFTDDDCLIHEDWVIKLSSKFNNDDQLMGVLGNAIWEDGSPMYSEDSLFRGNGLNMSFRKNVFMQIGLFDPHLGAGAVGFSAEDLDFITRIVDRNLKIAIFNDVLVTHKHRISPEEQSQIFFRDSKGQAIFLLKYLIYKGQIKRLRKLLSIVRYNFITLIQAKKEKNERWASEKYLRLKGTCLGAITGVFIWLILVPWERLTNHGD